ncbi:o-succinylbenzoate synthase [Thermomicrobium sp.]|uniref:o-succinylbenzoate synthase n=1 Tax=Thermomicrobium sp. TaxID=1969469 RepID=UPI001B0EFB82|nr:o-succinylbenzoate synthase [Thermomicrobium sp.]MBO9306590.1 o-succinylbenzoate synthase [Thermomicrobium sp.]
MSGSRLDWRWYRLRFRAPLETAAGSLGTRRGILVSVATADGLVGLGDVAPWPGTEDRALPEAAEWLAALRAVAEEGEGALRQALERVAAVTPGARAARAALETALLDVSAQRAGVPLAFWLRSSARSSVPVNALIGIADPERTVEAARAAVAAGFRVLKLKVRIAASEVERVAAVRRAVGPEVRLRLDANASAAVAAALAFARAVAPLGIEYLEQPVGSLEELAALRRQSPVPLAADEVLAGPDELERALALGAADIVIAKLPLVGSVERLLDLAERCERAGIAVVVTSNLESAVGLVAALHVAAALPGNAERAHGLATAGLVEPLGREPVLQPLGGRLVLPPGPGLGLDRTMMLAGEEDG